jgi:hypothetical protein
LPRPKLIPPELHILYCRKQEVPSQRRGLIIQELKLS